MGIFVFSFARCSRRARCSSKNIVGWQDHPWLDRDENSKFSNETNEKSGPSQAYEHTKGPSQSKGSVYSTPIVRVCFEYLILIKFKPGLWLLNLFSQVPKTWPNVWERIPLLWTTLETLMLCWVEGIEVDYPVFWKTISFLVKSIPPDLSSLEGHRELGLPNLLIKNHFPLCVWSVLRIRDSHMT